MRRIVTHCIAALAATAAHAGEPELAGFDRFSVSTSHRAGLMQASVWYPAGTRTYAGFIGKNAVFKGVHALVGAGVREGRYPVVLLSHGSGGNMDTISWLSSELAKRGIMVVAVNHPGTTSGDSSPRRSLYPAERARDLSAALDTLLADPFFEQYMDRERIVGAGFSLGGGTALSLAGLRFDPEAYASYCTEFETTAEDCAFFAKGGIHPGNIPAHFGENGKDHRISATIAIDPAFSYVVDTDSLSHVSGPVQLINLGFEHRWMAADAGPEGSNLAGRFPDVTYVEIGPAHHFTFLAECTDKCAAFLAEEKDDPVCDDPEGTDWTCP